MKKSNDAKNEKRLKKRFAAATQILTNPKKLDTLLNKAENKNPFMLSDKAKKVLSNIPEFISLIKSYIKKEYSEIPVKSIVAIISALLYFVSPFDAIPDIFPILGLTDDIAVLAFCLKSFNADIEKYKQWKNNNNTEQQ